jgi:hypothetical protein
MVHNMAHCEHPSVGVGLGCPLGRCANHSATHSKDTSYIQEALALHTPVDTHLKHKRNRATNLWKNAESKGSLNGGKAP